MKRTIVKIKSKMATDEIWCEVDGCTIELMGAYMALTQNLIESFKREGEHGVTALKLMLSDALEICKDNGIDVKELIEND